MAAPGPTWARSPPSWRNHGTCRRRSAVQGTTHTNKASGWATISSLNRETFLDGARGRVMDRRTTFMSVPPCCLCLKAPNGYVPLAGFRSDRAEMAFSPLAGGSQPSHLDRGSSLKLLYLRRHMRRLLEVKTRDNAIFSKLGEEGDTTVIHLTSWGESLSPDLWQLCGLSWRSEPEGYGPG